MAKKKPDIQIPTQKLARDYGDRPSSSIEFTLSFNPMPKRQKTKPEMKSVTSTVVKTKALPKRRG